MGGSFISHIYFIFITFLYPHKPFFIAPELYLTVKKRFTIKQGIITGYYSCTIYQ